MSSTRLFAALGATLALGASAFAASVVGTWNGHIQASLPKLPPNATPQQKQGMMMAQQMMAKMTIVLSLKANKTYTVGMQGGPAGMPKNQETGTWSQSGNKITLTNLKKQGPGPKAQTFTLSPSGKSLSMDIPPRQGMTGKVVFTKS